MVECHETKTPPAIKYSRNLGFSAWAVEWFGIWHQAIRFLATAGELCRHLCSVVQVFARAAWRTGSCSGHGDNGCPGLNLGLNGKDNAHIHVWTETPRATMIRQGHCNHPLLSHVIYIWRWAESSSRA